MSAGDHRTEHGGVLTRQGYFPHAAIVHDHGLIDAPVRVIVHDIDSLPDVHQCAADAVWCALPGGGSVAVCVQAEAPC